MSYQVAHSLSKKDTSRLMQRSVYVVHLWYNAAVTLYTADRSESSLEAGVVLEVAQSKEGATADLGTRTLVTRTSLHFLHEQSIESSI